MSSTVLKDYTDCSVFGSLSASQDSSTSSSARSPPQPSSSSSDAAIEYTSLAKATTETARHFETSHFSSLLRASCVSQRPTAWSPHTPALSSEEETSLLAWKGQQIQRSLIRRLRRRMGHRQHMLLETSLQSACQRQWLEMGRV